MTLERRLQLVTAFLAAWGSLLLGHGQQSVLLPLLMAVAAAASVYFTDFRGWVRLSRGYANFFALLAAGYAVFDFAVQREPQPQLLAVANLLIYLQLVLLFQAKSVRVYWQLIVLSLLQVVVAAALNQAAAFAVLLGLYVAAALAALALLAAHQESQEFGRAAASLAGTAALAGAGGGAAAEAARRERLLGGPPRAAPRASAAELSAGMASWPLAGRVAGLGAASLAFALAVFFSVPRFGAGRWSGGAGGGARTIGFTQQLTFDELGDLAANDEPALRVRFVELDTGEAYHVMGEPYFRGAVLTEYGYAAGPPSWTPPSTPLPLGADPFDGGLPLPAPPAEKGLVRQEIAQAPVDDQALFAILPAFALPEAPGRPGTPEDVRLDPRTQKLFRSPPGDAAAGEFTYALATNGLRNGWQAAATPAAPGDGGDPARRLRGLSPRVRAELPELCRIAAEVVREEGAELGPVEKAEALQRHLSRTGGYAYSLSAPRDQRYSLLDPNEEFVAHRKTGHCEYFASAMALMLRSQDTPARVVVGFKGGEYNSVGGFYVVRQRDAHAWVEIYLTPEEARLYTPDPLAAEHGAWMRFDPTPSESRLSAADRDRLWGRAGDALDYLQLLWNDYVLGLTPRRQQSGIYDPLGRGASETLSRLVQPASWPAALQELLRSLGLEPEQLRNYEWFSWRGGLAASLLLLLLSGAWRGAVWAWRQGRAWRAAERRPVRKRPPVEFYRRLARLLARHGLRRAPSQTPREFALAAEARLLGTPAADAAHLPARLTEAFYRVRFGERELTPAEEEAVTHDLAALAAALARPRPAVAR